MSIFPDPRMADENGILCAGGSLDVETLAEAYKMGIFPWPHEGFPLLWFCPQQRGIIHFDNFHIPSRFVREAKKSGWKVKVNGDFENVIAHCKESKRKGQTGTWITTEMQHAYVQFHQAGYAHSFEVYSGEDELIGGLYGVYIGGVMSGESMFFKETGASKVALVAAVHILREFSLHWLDIQMVTPLTASFGAEEWSQAEFLRAIELSHPNSMSEKQFAKKLGQLGSIDVDELFKN